MKKFSLLTPEEENLIPKYQEKWRNIQLSTKPIDRQKAEDAVKAACAVMRTRVPEIVFCDSPYAALKLKSQSSDASQQPNSIPKWIAFFIWRQVIQAHAPISRLRQSLNQSFIKQWKKKFKSLMSSISSTEDIQGVFNQILQDLSDVNSNLQAQFFDRTRNFTDEQVFESSTESFPSDIENSEQKSTNSFFQKGIFRWFYTWYLRQACIAAITAKIQGIENLQVDAQIQGRLFESPEFFQQKSTILMSQAAAIASIGLDFSTSVLKFSINEKRWQAFQSLVRECGWIFSFDRQIVICDRPRKLSFDDENRLHAEGKPAIQFADGFSIYAHHGVILPEKYGQLHPEQWQAQWLLEERNAELRRVLIQGVGYARLCQDLDAIELDSWQEYTLLKIENDVDVEPIHLLKMTCPSTAYIHAARVPPNLRSAREAIRWVNWDTDPEEFSQQT